MSSQKGVKARAGKYGQDRCSNEPVKYSQSEPIGATVLPSSHQWLARAVLFAVLFLVVKPPVIIGILIVIAAGIALLLSQQRTPAPAVAFCDALPKFAPVAASTITALKTEDLLVGTGDTAQAGRQAVMNYIGYLPDGKSFDSSCTAGRPFDLSLGAGQVIQGWEQGIPGMKVGGHRRLFIPASLGYGAQGAGGGVIPPNTPLIFDVELVAVQ